MVRIVKTMQAKHFETLSPWLSQFCNTACSIDLPLLPQHLASFPTIWPFPRGDLYHWISLLNRFDHILLTFCKIYKLDEGPQMIDFSCELLETNLGGSTESTHNYNIADLGYGADGDRMLLESILGFSRMLLQNCGNRSLYASSSYLNSLLNTTSLSLLEATLLLGIELAQRYQAALKRMHNQSKHQANMLLNHYNIDLDRVNQLAMPFAKKASPLSESVAQTTPSAKGKEKANFSTPTSHKILTTTVYANDLVSMVKGGSGVGTSPKNLRNGAEHPASRTDSSWEEWGDVKITYYPKATDINSSATSNIPHGSSSPATPVTPTPVRRTSNLRPHGHRTNSGSEESPVSRSPNVPAEETQRPNFKTIEISSSSLKTKGIHSLLQENGTGLPQEFQYELLTKLRVADALTSSLQTRQQLLAVRLLAITNLAYIHLESAFIDTVLKQDGDEPRRLQLVYQLAELIHPPTDGDVAVPRPLQTVALSTLDALSQHQAKYPDICTALNTNVNHGVLLYVVRKAVAEMGVEGTHDKVTVEDEWRDALFSLISNIAVMPRTGGDLVTAGLIPILVEIITLRTSVAERYQPKVVNFLDNIMYSARDAFQTLVNADGLDAISNLIVFQVTTAAEHASSGQGMQSEHRSATVDYEIPFFQQQTLKWLFKFIHHMMTTAGGYGGNFDRLLRNLIDSTHLLGSMREVITNAHCFGSIVWTNAVAILNDFINNEPTSFAVIAEAGLSKGLLEAVTCKPIVMPSQPKKTEPETEEPNVGPQERGTTPSVPSDDEDSETEYAQPMPRPSLSDLQTPREGPLARGIMPTSETISIVPQAFGAICLNTAGMKMFQASGALESFFEVFESPEHIKCMDANKDLPASLGSTFDELVRHHPPLKASIMNAILNMVTRVSSLCKMKAQKEKIGTKLWIFDSLNQKSIIADSAIRSPGFAPKSAKGKEKAIETGGDVEMTDADPENATNSPTTPSELGASTSMTPYINAVSIFLTAIFSNDSVRSDFSNKGGIEFVLDMVDSPCLSYDFANGGASRTLQGVVASLAEKKPQLTMPSLLRRAQIATDTLAEFRSFQPDNPGEPYFLPYIDRETQSVSVCDWLARGTSYAKALVNTLSLVSTLNQCFLTPSAYNHRSVTTTFNQLNLGDYYVNLVKSLGELLGASFKELSAMEKAVPDYYKNTPRVKDLPSFSVTPIVSDPESQSPAVGPISTGLEAPPMEQLNGDSSATLATETVLPLRADKPKSLTKSERDSPEFKNYQTLTHLLRKMSGTISPFLQTLGKGLVSKQRGGLDGFQRQSHAAIADALARAILAELSPPDGTFTLEQASHWMATIQVLKDMLIEVSRHNERPIQTITLVLQAFKAQDGFSKVNAILNTFAKLIKEATPPISPPDHTAESFQVNMAVMGMRSILSLYGHIVSGKNVTEATQTVSMSARDRSGSRSETFSPPQFLVELRMAILPTIRELWESSLLEKAPSEVSEKLIEVIKAIAHADSESGALKRSDKPPSPVKPHHKTFKINEEHLASLTERLSDRELAQEALYRCNNNLNLATDYGREAQQENRPRHPIPEGDLVEHTNSSRPPTGTSTGSATPEYRATSARLIGYMRTSRSRQVSADSSEDAAPSLPIPATGEDDPLADVPGLIESISQQMPPPAATSNDSVAPQNFDFSAILDQMPNSRPASSGPRASSSSVPQEPPKEELPVKQVYVDDLNEEREKIRDNLIEKCLDVINAHGEVTFEVADLISTVVSKSPDPSEQRSNVGGTLVIALMSFAGEEDLAKCGKKVAAYAHLLALLLRDKLFYAAAVPELKENLSTLLGFIKLSPNHSADELSPWIPHILLIIEMLLSEDERPRSLVWKTPQNENEEIQGPVLQPFEPSVPQEEQEQLLTAIVDILPHIKKDESLALSILRILVILTRNRPVAQKMGEKRNIQRLFVMAKQLAGVNSSRIQSPLMIILRHIIEDEETIKQIMRSDIKAYLEQAKTQRSANDVSLYLRTLAHTALRSPHLFVDVTNEMVKFSRWSYPSSDGTTRPNSLALKETSPAHPVPKPSEDAVQPTVQATEDLTLQDVKPSTETIDTEMLDASKVAPPEHKLPIVENPDGVIHFLLCELLNYKEVDDKESVPALAGPTATTTVPTTNGETSTPTVSDPSSPSSPTDKSPKPLSKAEFKAEEHPIYIYRCFLLQCLTELLGSYNRTKIEFINFKRSAPPQAMTPSKPRSSVLNYLLNELIPIGTMDHIMTVALQKKITTSSWADSVITALLAKTGEQLIDKDREPSDGEDEPDLVFVRKFVLENILKSYKEASISNEPLDLKYSKMYSLAELMDHIIHEKSAQPDTFIAQRSHAQLRRLMYEKGFITALTTSIADVDLNFPGAKRAVKKILVPLKLLTTTAVQLSDLSLISSSPGQEEDEIESATSVSDVEDDREETPDLFRNSTLGMFEPGRESASSSDSDDDDEEMYEDGYGDEMEYEEEVEVDAEDDISEEDEEDVEGMGPIEGMDGDHPLEVDVIMEVDDEDDDEDEDNDSDSDDDDHDSEDDEGRVEIIDEAGNVQELGMEHDMEEWEDEEDEDDQEGDEEEEDYEGQAQDQDEEAIHGMEAMMGGPNGPLGELVRALGGGNAALQSVADRIDHEMQDEDLDDIHQAEIDDEVEELEERMGGEYIEEDEEDDDEGDDMDDEMFLDQYPGDGGGPVAFGWEGEVDPPMVVHRHGHHHRPRHAMLGSPFPFFPGDHLGGESISPVRQPVQPSAHRVPAPHVPVRNGEEEAHQTFDEMNRYDPWDDPEYPLAPPSPDLETVVYEFVLPSRRAGPPDLSEDADVVAIERSRLLDEEWFRRLVSGFARPPSSSDRQMIREAGMRPDFSRTYRSHMRGQPPPGRATDEGINPLLQRASQRASRDGRPSPSGWVHALGPSGADLMDLSRGGAFGEGPAAAALFEMIRSLPDMPGRNGAASLQFHISTAPGQEIPRDLQALMGIRAGARYDSVSRRDGTEPANAVFFPPQNTTARWKEEAQILFGGTEYTVVAGILKTAIDSVLVPPAIEADKIKKAAEAEHKRKVEEETKKRQEEERVAREAKEAEEKAEKEKKEAEAAIEAARLAAEASAERADQPETTEVQAAEHDETSSDAMEGVEAASSPSGEAAPESTPEDRPRVTTIIRGNTMDITDLGIDPEFLAELPEDLREEVIMSTVAERRSAATATGGNPSEIDQEFLDALPDDIRDEIIQQERQERRRREREEARRQQAAAGGAAAVPDMDAASILATLPPALRQQVLLEQDEDILNMLPQELADQARAVQREHPAHHGGRGPMVGGLARRGAPLVGADATHPTHTRRLPRRAIVQMMDKSGIATLLRLMYTFQHNQLRSSLNGVLENISLNRNNRIEVLSTLLHILQEGSIDMPAVERSFAQLSIRAKQPKEKDPKTPQAPLKRTFTGMSTSISLTHPLSEAASPLLVVQQCLGALTSLTLRNQHVPAYFLTEHDAVPGLKRNLSRRGKGKENKAGKFAINSLLSLLDRELIMDNSSIMEGLSTLLSSITNPLQNFQRKQKEAEDAAKKAAETAAAAVEAPPSIPDSNAEATSPETATTNDQTANEQPLDHPTEPAVESEVPAIPSATGDASTSEAPKPETTLKEQPKKTRPSNGPPVIPEQNLKLVINIFVARECSSKTFRETLSTIKNLSAIPGAKAIFGRELITKAQVLGEIILLDLEELLPQIQKATTGTEIQGVALAKFSPGGSDQNKLLRVLTALDHLFDPKRDKKDQTTDGDSELVEKQDLLSSLYENSTFGPMWEKLSACLSAIRQREHMLNVATILLPLIESLMVVCKNTTLKEAPVRQQGIGKEMMLTSPPPESRMESLFFTFTEEHRKILNDLVRHTPKLMSGTFSLLVKNPKVLEFDNKRNYFSRSIHTKATNSRQSFSPLQLSVRRDQVFHDSFKSLYFKSADEMKYGKLSIRFHGEEGVDAGGVTREWFQVLSRQMFDPGYALFIPVSSDRTTFHPNQLSSINEEHLMFFKFIGRIIGKALYEGRVLDCHFSRAVYKRILGKSVSVKDMESLDPEYYKSLIWMLENDITDVLSETFSVDNDKFGVVETIDFIPDGRTVPVTQENKHEYVRLMVEWRLTGSVKEQLDEFLKGFHDIIPAELVAIFNEQELELLISGLPEIDVDDWKGNTEYHNYTASSPQIQWFWRAIRSYDKEERAKLLQFVTGTSKVPLNGFKELEGMNGFSRFNIHRDYGNKERLPSSHTCFNQLDLPEYESYESLRSHVLTAITAGSEYFGFA